MVSSCTSEEEEVTSLLDEATAELGSGTYSARLGIFSADFNLDDLKFGRNYNSEH